MGKTVADFGISAAISVAASAAGAISSGASMGQSLASALSYRVMCKIEVENWTKYTLWSPDSHINAGIIEFPPVAVRPGQREMFVSLHIVIDICVILKPSFASVNLCALFLQ